MTRRPVGLVWQALLTEVFSTLARLECVSRCRDSATRRYHHESLVNLVVEEEIHPTLADCHRLIWSEWLGGTLEQQHADLLLYLCQPNIGKTETLHLWRTQAIFLDWIPDFTDLLEQAHFHSNFRTLLGHFHNEGGYRIAVRPCRLASRRDSHKSAGHRSGELERPEFRLGEHGRAAARIESALRSIVAALHRRKLPRTPVRFANAASVPSLDQIGLRHQDRCSYERVQQPESLRPRLQRAL